MTEWFINKILRVTELNDDEARREILAEMSIKLQSLTRQDLKEISRNLNFSGLFSQLTSNDRKSIEEICNILKILMEGLEPGEVHRRYPSELRLFIKHSESAARALALKELEREAAGSPEILEQLLHDGDLLRSTLERIGDEDLGVANLAMGIAKKIGSEIQGARILYSGESLRTIAKLLAKNDATSFRVYEVVVAIAKNSEEGLEASANSGFLHGLINVLDNDDILLQLNALEAMSDLAESDHGLDYLQEQKVLKRLADKIARAGEDPLSGLFIPGLMKFFGSVARRRPDEIFSKYPVVITSLFELIQAEDTSLLGNALDTLGHVASSVQGKYALQMLGDSMPCALLKISEIIRNSPNELRLRGLENLALILHLDKQDQDNRTLTLTKSWFDRLADNPLGVVVTLSKQPFADIRQSSLLILATLSSQNWGQEYIANFPGLLEFLLDRGAETFKNCKDLKYQIVKNLVDSDSEVFDPESLDKLKKFVLQGPYHVDQETEVTTEGAS
ncbi:26S proteasome non-ATPase regulatory subunit 5 [Venturia canescens]|uniref:26S proteasome non-ATPase regulatory subunit 5 n=1 Tax=Venturia canescens TaxID=32260 RepID=UPI001C9C0712|nr:26S proteasome non-ATPase regulatory subunit 5 [Venturia canescens]